MVGYADRTFCPYRECKEFDDCFHALTDKILEDAKEWWGGKEGAPIVQWAEKPGCFVQREQNETRQN